MKARFGNPNQYNFRLFRGSRSCTSFNNILFSRTGSLHHLVDCPVAPLKVFMAKIIRHVENSFRLLVAEKLPVIATAWN